MNDIYTTDNLLRRVKDLERLAEEQMEGLDVIEKFNQRLRTELKELKDLNDKFCLKISKLGEESETCEKNESSDGGNNDEGNEASDRRTGTSEKGTGTSDEDTKASGYFKLVLKQQETLKNLRKQQVSDF